MRSIRDIHPVPGLILRAVDNANNTSSNRKAMLVLGAAIGMSAGFSTLYFSTLGIFLKPIATTFGWGRAQLSATALIAMLAVAIAAPMIGKLICRFGPFRIIAGSIFLFSAGLFGMSQLNSSLLALGVLSFFTGFFGAATTPLGYLSAFPQHFDKRLGLALGCAMTGIGVGAAVSPIAAQALITAYGWREAYLWLAGIALMLGAIALAINFIFTPRSRLPNLDRGNRNARMADDSVEGETLKIALRSSHFWIIIIAVGIVSTASLGAFVHLSAILTDRGISAVVAASVVSIVGVTTALGRLFSGVLMDWISARFVAAAGFILVALGLAIIAWTPPGASILFLACAAALLGTGLGAEGDLIPFLVRRYFGRKAFGTLYGYVFSVYVLGGVLGPVVVGLGFDRGSSYTQSLLAMSAGCIGSALLILLLGQYRYAGSSK